MTLHLLITPGQAAAMLDHRAVRVHDAALGSCHKILAKREVSEFDAGRFREAAYILGILDGVPTTVIEARLRAGQM